MNEKELEKFTVGVIGTGMKDWQKVLIEDFQKVTHDVVAPDSVLVEYVDGVEAKVTIADIEINVVTEREMGGVVTTDFLTEENARKLEADLYRLQEVATDEVEDVAKKHKADTRKFLEKKFKGKKRF